LTVSGHPVLKRVDGNCMHCELVGRAEDTDGNFLEVYKNGYIRALSRYWGEIIPHGLRQGFLLGDRCVQLICDA
jgi:hypothetical protein